MTSPSSSVNGAPWLCGGDAEEAVVVTTREQESEVSVEPTSSGESSSSLSAVSPHRSSVLLKSNVASSNPKKPPVRSSSSFFIENKDLIRLEIFDDKQVNDSPLYHRWMRNRLAGYILRRYPRVSSLFLAVLVPFVLLIMLSLLLGSWLSHLEAAHEIATNDSTLAFTSSSEVNRVTIPHLTARLPQLCTHFFLQNRTSDVNQEELVEAFYHEADFESESVALLDVFGTPDASELTINPHELFRFMVSCGEQMRARSRLYLEETIADSLAAASGLLTFNWIRCFPAANRPNVLSGLLQSRDMPLEDITPDAQRAFFYEQWKTSRERIHDELYKSYLDSKMDPAEAQSRAYQEAKAMATGGGKCELNAAGSAWFWFTVMTTVGYGNQAPATLGGRAMVFTFGFLSILIFASILASAGAIVAFVFENAVQELLYQKHLQDELREQIEDDLGPSYQRNKEDEEPKKKSAGWCACLFWAIACYGWLAVIALATKSWKDERLDDSAGSEENEFTMLEGYWFAYITATTVGLGDYFLEPELVLNRDMWYFPFVILIGFTFFAAFLGKFNTLLQNLLDTHNRRGFVESLLKDVEHMGALAKAFPRQDPHGLLRTIEDEIEEEHQRITSQREQVSIRRRRWRKAPTNT